MHPNPYKNQADPIVEKAMSLSGEAKDGEVKLTWSPVPGVSGYRVFKDAVEVSRPHGTSWTDKDVSGAHVYTVRFVKSGAVSEDSNAVTLGD